MERFLNELDFTGRSEEDFYEIVDATTFRDQDAQMIYAHLKKRIRLIPFGDYLKRYIFEKVGFEGNYSAVDLKEYQSIIIDSFGENFTPKSFGDTSAKLSALAKNWLTQTSVNRQVVFLLGFGLNMRVEDVTEFLTHAQMERDFNFKNPFEIICWYCYKNGLKYAKYAELMQAYKDLPTTDLSGNLDATIGVRDLFFKVESEKDLMDCLAQIKFENDGSFFSVTAKQYFDDLYSRTKTIIAHQYTEDAQEEAQTKAQQYLNRSENSMRLTIEEKRSRADEIKDGYTRYTAEGISEADVEKFLCCGIPYDQKGNLLKNSASAFAKHFRNKRMSRQHLRDILLQKTDVDRFDLITLCFFVHAMDGTIDNSKARYTKFVNEISQILEECYMGDLYLANPYECFILMCILSDYPMGSYADVLEQAFEEE